jgi:ABC-type branched-subunit amino acid transport system substrate-binding protein
MQRTRPRRLYLTATATALLLAPALAACGGGSGTPAGGSTSTTGVTASGGAYHITVLADLTGGIAVNAKPGVAGVQSAVAAINTAGGINGKKLDVSVIDTRTSIDTARTGAQQAISDHPFAVIMFMGGDEGVAVTPLLQAAHIPVLSPALPDSSLYPAQSGLFMPSVSATQNADAAVAFAKQKADGSLKNAVIDVAELNNPYTEGVLKDMTPLIEAAGGKVNRVETYDFGLASFATQASAIARDKPTIVFELGAADDTVVVSKAITASGVTGRQIGISTNASQDVITQLGTASYWAPTEDTYPSQNAAFLAAAAKAGQKSGVLGSTYSTAGWVATYVLSQGIAKCGDSCSSADMNAALQQVTGYTVPLGVSYGTINLSASNHITASTVRFHNYNPATKQWTQSVPISIAG